MSSWLKAGIYVSYESYIYIYLRSSWQNQLTRILYTQMSATFNRRRTSESRNVLFKVADRQLFIYNRETSLVGIEQFRLQQEVNVPTIWFVNENAHGMHTVTRIDRWKARKWIFDRPSVNVYRYSTSSTVFRWLRKRNRAKNPYLYLHTSWQVLSIDRISAIVVLQAFHQPKRSFNYLLLLHVRQVS